MYMTKKHIQVMRYIYNRGEVPKHKLLNHHKFKRDKYIEGLLDDLNQEDYIIPVNNARSPIVYICSYKAEVYIEKKNKDFKTFFFPYLVTTLIAISSLVFNFISLFK